ncbi:MAG: serine/threonine-protein phosphatase [Erysipelotrichaceae bacterium]|nr:serine/threonine-protein phosphatase [Erysipelotrichaceae bacterium]
MEYFGITDIGNLREKNQDAFLMVSNAYDDLLLMVADGIGGGKAGEVASIETVAYFERIFKDSGPFSDIEDVRNFLAYHADAVNRHVLQMSLKYPEYEGMGTTLTGVLITSLGDIVINCGDSRVYGISDGQIVPLTRDDTYVNQMLDEGRITYEEAMDHPKKHYLVKAIGIYEDCNADIHQIEAMDQYLVCSDGLHSYVSNDEMLHIILDENKTSEEKTNMLKDLSLEKGGYDNITVILFKR